MTAGWEIVGSIENLDPGQDLDARIISNVCDELAVLNARIREDVAMALEKHGRGKFANGLRGAFNNDVTLFNEYFGNRAYSWGIATAFPADPFDACRATVVLHLAMALQAFLIDALRGLPGARVVNADSSPSPGEFARVYRFINLRQLISAVKTVQFDVEGFAGAVHDLLERPNDLLRFGRSGHWPFDADVLGPLVLLGYGPSPSPDVVNSVVLGSAIVAAGVLRSHLEAVLWRIDFESTLKDTSRTEADTWDQALAIHVDAGKLDAAWRMWITQLYGLLSDTLHTGRVLTVGEIWAFRSLVKELREKLAG